MKLNRRDALGLAVGGLASLASGAKAQSVYPDHAIHVPLGFAPGAGADILARYYAHKLEELAKQPVIVDNKPGATGNIALRFAAHAEPDGYTILFTANSNMAGSLYLFKEPPVDTLNDFKPVASFAQIAFVMVVAPNSPVNTVAELIARIKSKPDSIAGYTNQTGQLATELFKQMTGLAVRTVSYKSTADSMKDVLDGTLDFMVIDGTFAAGQVRQGQLKALAVTTAKRSPTFPDTPTLQETGLAGFEFAPWWCVYVPAKTPQPIIDKLGAWMHQIAKDPDTPKFLESVGSIVNDDTAAEADARLRAELPKWDKLVKAAGIELQ